MEKHREIIHCGRLIGFSEFCPPTLAPKLLPYFKPSSGSTYPCNVLWYLPSGVWVGDANYEREYRVLARGSCLDVPIFVDSEESLGSIWTFDGQPVTAPTTVGASLKTHHYLGCCWVALIDDLKYMLRVLFDKERLTQWKCIDRARDRSDVFIRGLIGPSCPSLMISL